MQFSLKWLFALVAFVAVSCFAIMNCKPYCYTLLYWVAFLFLLLSVPAAIYSQGSRRAYFGGFAFFGWKYVGLLVLVSARIMSGLALSPPSSLIAPYIANLVASDFTVEEAVENGWMHPNDAARIRQPAGRRGPARQPTPPGQGGAIVMRYLDEIGIYRVLNSITTIAFALFGGFSTQALYVRERRKQANQPVKG